MVNRGQGRQQLPAPSTNSDLIFSSGFKVQTFTNDLAGAFVVSNRHFLAAKFFPVSDRETFMGRLFVSAILRARPREKAYEKIFTKKSCAAL
jgi:hypothetical protein